MARSINVEELNLTEYKAKNRKFAETVVFVPFYGGSQKHLLRHIRLVNEIGFDVVAFDLSFDERFILKRIPVSRTNSWGILHIWADEIHAALEEVSGNKHIFSFSNPTASALKAITQIKKRDDIRSLICDGGPFQQSLRCVWNLTTHEFKIKSRVLRFFATAGMVLTWGPDHPIVLKKSVKSLKEGFPILSIRAWKDELVPVSAIEKAFADGTQLDLRTFEIPEAKHLSGLKDSPRLYKEKVSEFLREHSFEIGQNVSLESV